MFTFEAYLSIILKSSTRAQNKADLRLTRDMPGWCF